MTAQIAIMNRNAVAMATDSAVTSRNTHGVKVHNSANKLFTLSKYHPVGIMIYASADFMGYPWETLIKVYRAWLDKTSFGTLTEYAGSFFTFLRDQQELFPASRQNEWFRTQILSIVSVFKDEFNNRVRAHIDENGTVDDQAMVSMFQSLLSEVTDLIMTKPVMGMYEDPERLDRFRRAVTPIIRDAITETFQAVPINALYQQFEELLQYRLISDSTPNYSGIVFAGFGEHEMLPVVESHTVDGIFDHEIRHRVHDILCGNLNEDQGSQILPFAQSDSVHRFLSGIDPAYKRQALNHIDTLAEDICNHVATTHADLHPSQESRNAADMSLRGAFHSGKERFLEQLNEVEKQKFIFPVLDVISGLPKDDLAALAESLVNLTSLQRKILSETETVGGPIDVAVISKGDGFIWIKRKHYFDKDLNPAFFANYYREDRNDDREKD